MPKGKPAPPLLPQGHVPPPAPVKAAAVHAPPPVVAQPAGAAKGGKAARAASLDERRAKSGLAKRLPHEGVVYRRGDGDQQGDAAGAGGDGDGEGAGPGGFAGLPGPRNPVQFHPRGGAMQGARARIVLVSTSPGGDGQDLAAAAGVEDFQGMTFVPCDGLGLRRPPWQYKHCTGDSGFVLCNVCREDQFPLVLHRLLQAIQHQLRYLQQHPGFQTGEVRVACTDHHGKHPSVAVVNMMGQLLRSRGWWVGIRHLTPQYTTCLCTCASEPRGSRTPCQEIWKTIRPYPAGRESHHQQCVRLHDEQLDARVEAVELFFAAVARRVGQYPDIPW